MKKTRKQQLGLTILELFITMGVVAIASTLALSSISYLMSSSQAEDYTRELTKAINFSRVQAVSIGQTVTMCVVENGACINSWGKEVTIFVDSNNNRTLGTNTVLRMVDAIPSGDVLKYTGTSSGISFYSDGSIGDGDGGEFTYYVDNACSTKSRGIDVNDSGRTRFIESISCS